jgi:hypothetical protein
MTNTYAVKFKCPQCKQTLSFDKKRNGVSPQALKLRVYSEHQPECEKKNVRYKNDPRQIDYPANSDIDTRYQ